MSVGRGSQGGEGQANANAGGGYIWIPSLGCCRSLRAVGEGGRPG